MKIQLLLVLLFVCAFAYAQNTITGTFPNLASQQIKLVGFTGFDIYTIDTVTANEKGLFNFSYGEEEYGMGYLVAEANKPLFIILSGETIKLTGDAFALAETIEILEGMENQIFEQYATEHPRREQVLSAWEYLEKIYSKDSFFTLQQLPKQAIVNEKQRIKVEDSLFLASLDPGTYVSYYLPLRKLVSSVPTIAQYRTEEIPITISAFRQLNYTDPRLHKSGLLKDVIESHFWLIENSGCSLDSIYIEMNKSIDRMVENLIADEKKLNEITEYLFKLLEKRSLFKASEYLALKLLNEKSCTINNDFSARLEIYRAMKVGNTAPDIDLHNNKPFLNNTVNKLSDIKSEYTLLVFGSSWCPQCAEEAPKIINYYPKWRDYGLEVIFISLDTNKEEYALFTKGFPFISSCDFKKWETKAVKDYHVFSTPTLFLLDSNRTIILRPISIEHVEAWVNYKLKNVN